MSALRRPRYGLPEPEPDPEPEPALEPGRLRSISFLEHLEELRKRIINACIAVAVGMVSRSCSSSG